MLPEAKRITVFNRGISQGFKGSIPAGGHMQPSSTVGLKAEWKKAQPIEIKKNTSDITNRINPKVNPCCTLEVCDPWKVFYVNHYFHRGSDYIFIDKILHL